MRRIVGRALALLLAFSCGISLALAFRGVVGESVRRLALRAEERIKAPYVAEGENNFRNRRILFDMRDHWEAPDDARPGDSSFKDYEAQAKEEHELKPRIMPKLFPGGYLDDYGQCSAETKGHRAVSDEDLARARREGQFVPYIYESFHGHFTEPGASQVLYKIGMGECNARSGELPYTRVLAVFDRWDGLYASSEVTPVETVFAVKDIDGDEIDEVLLGRGETRGYNSVARIRLVSFKGGSMRVLHDFGVAYAYSYMDEAGDGRVVTIPVIYYTPCGDGETPEFELDFYRGFCSKSEGCGFLPKPGAWHYFKSGALNDGDLPGFGPESALPDLLPNSLYHARP